MNKKNLYDLYEKTYFHEMEVREKLVGRVQINFALVATGYAILSYMVRMLDFEQNPVVIGLFIISVSICLVLSFYCIRRLVKAFWGNEYQGMPTGLEIDDYRTQLVSHKLKIDNYNAEYLDATQPEINVDEMVADFVYNQFRDCSTHNTKINDSRSFNIHKSFGWLLYCSIPLFIASSLFIIGNLDVSSPRKETPISNKSLTEQFVNITTVLETINESIGDLKGVKMTEYKTPPPPPPPSQPQPRRVIESDQPERKL
ncbi:hypothetical protein [Aliivibrio sifiae]|uniref:hypothetical protein n=1 Tax=Aliivibrio sifiae TaxID=566293 RepID=UPI003D0FF2D7